MVYLWEDPRNVLNRDIGKYNEDLSPNKYMLHSGRQLKVNEFQPEPILNFKIPKQRIHQFDCLPNTGSSPLVSNRVKSILETLAPDDVQFFPAKLFCADGELDGYFFLNITHKIKGIDHEKSVYTKMLTVDHILSIYYLTYKEGCMGKHHLARDKEYSSILLVSEWIKSIFVKEHITGVSFERPEDFYSSFYRPEYIEEVRRRNQK